MNTLHGILVELSVQAPKDRIIMHPEVLFEIGKDNPAEIIHSGWPENEPDCIKEMLAETAVARAKKQAIEDAWSK